MIFGLFGNQVSEARGGLVQDVQPGGGAQGRKPPKSEPTIKSARAKPVEPGTLISPNLSVFCFLNSFLHRPHGRSYKANLNV